MTRPTLRSSPTDQFRSRGLASLQRGAFGEAVDHFRRVVRAVPNSAEDRALLGQALAQSGRPAEAEAELRTALALAPAAADLHACLGQVLARGERRVQAVQHFEAALRLDPGHWAAGDLTALKAQVSSSVHSWHLPMLADRARNDAFQQAIEAAVRPDDIVLDIGTGTGLLAMMAARAGARRIVACEMLPDLAELARLVVAANGYGSRIDIVAKRSMDMVVGVDLPERATVLVSETFDALLIGEGAIDGFGHAREHLLAPGARLIPQGGTIRAQLATVPRLKTMHPLHDISGFDLSAFARHGLEKQFYPVQLETEDWTPLSDPFDVLRLDFRQPIASRQSWSIAASATREGVVQALVLWVDLQLDATTRLSSGPGGTARHWNPVVFLFDETRAVQPGEAVALTARMGGNVLYFAL